MNRLFIAIILALAIVSSSYAHHSAAGVDRTKTVNLEGTVKRFNWANPHSYLEVEVVNSKGTTDLWSLEMTSPAFLVKTGWKSTTVKAGEKVKFTANPMKNGDPGGLFLSVTLENGVTYSERNPPTGGTAAPASAPAAPGRD